MSNTNTILVCDLSTPDARFRWVAKDLTALKEAVRVGWPDGASESLLESVLGLSRRNVIEEYVEEDEDACEEVEIGSYPVLVGATPDYCAYRE